MTEHSTDTLNFECALGDPKKKKKKKKMGGTGAPLGVGNQCRCVVSAPRPFPRRVPVCVSPLSCIGVAAGTGGPALP